MCAFVIKFEFPALKEQGSWSFLINNPQSCTEYFHSKQFIVCSKYSFFRFLVEIRLIFSSLIFNIEDQTILEGILLSFYMVPFFFFLFFLFCFFILILLSYFFYCGFGQSLFYIYSIVVTVAMIAFNQATDVLICLILYVQ